MTKYKKTFSKLENDMKKLTPINPAANRARGYKRHNASHEEHLAKERLKYIEHKCPLAVGDRVEINCGPKQYDGSVIRVNLKTITVRSEEGTAYRVDKISLYGYPVRVFDRGEYKAKTWEHMSIKFKEMDNK